VKYAKLYNSTERYLTGIIFMGPDQRDTKKAVGAIFLKLPQLL
jgi:hypothetical protein